MIASQDVQTTFFPTVIVRSPYPRTRSASAAFATFFASPAVVPAAEKYAIRNFFFLIHSGISSLSFFQNSNSLPFRARSKAREDKDESHRADKDAANP